MTQYSEHPKRQLNELEAFIGNILGKTGEQNRRQREASKSMKDEFNELALSTESSILKTDEEYSIEALARSIACFAVSLEDRNTWSRKENLQSFKYVAMAICLREVDRHLSDFALEHVYG